MKQRVTISDVAKAAGVSKQTVSRAINDKGEINPETKARILEIIEQLGYRPSRLARGMTTQQTYTIGVVVSNIANPFFPEIIRGVQDVAQAHDYTIVLCNSDDSPKIEMKMLHVLAAQEVDGIILYSGNVNTEELEQFLTSYRPLVLVNDELKHPHVSTIAIDIYQGASLVADYFVKQQHEHVALLMPDTGSIDSIRRVQGFKEQLESHGRRFSDKQIFTAPATLDGGYQATQKLLAHYPVTTAIFAYNDLMALGAIRACKEHGLQIPQDIAVIGFDDIRFASMAFPSLTTVRIDKYNIGQIAMRRLLEMIEQDDQDFPPITIGVELIIRESA